MVKGKIEKIESVESHNINRCANSANYIFRIQISLVIHVFVGRFRKRN